MDKTDPHSKIKTASPTTGRQTILKLYAQLAISDDKKKKKITVHCYPIIQVLPRWQFNNIPQIYSRIQ